MSDNTINQRVEKIVKDLGGNTNLFANRLGVPSTVIYNVIKGRNKPSYDLLVKIINVYRINPSWLLLDKGEMLFPFMNSDIDEVSLTNDLNKVYWRFKMTYENLQFIEELLEEKFNISFIESDLQDEKTVFEYLSDEMQNSVTMEIEKKKRLKIKLEEAEMTLLSRLNYLFRIYKRCVKNKELNPQNEYDLCQLQQMPSLNYQYFVKS